MTECTPSNDNASLQCLAILSVRNEGAFLLDWLAHHRAAGFNSFLVFSNDCQDGTDVMLDRLQDLGWLQHVRNEGPYHDRGVQFTALKLAKDQRLVQVADWILPLDIDEYVNIKTGDKTLGALFQALPDATAITLTWRLFGNAGAVRYEDLPVTRRFTHCAPEVVNWPWRASMFKTLYRNDGTYRAFGVHRPRAPKTEKLENARWFDGEGRELPEDFKSRRIFSNYGQPNYHLAQLNHYSLGDMESFILKADRGRAVHSDHLLGLDYWIERNFNMAEDTSVLALDERADVFRDRLLSDHELAKMRQRAVAWRKDRFEELMLHDASRALFGRLLMAAPSRLVSAPAAQFLVDYALRAAERDAISD